MLSRLRRSRPSSGERLLLDRPQSSCGTIQREPAVTLTSCDKATKPKFGIARLDELEGLRDRGACTIFGSIASYVPSAFIASIAATP